MGLNPGWPFGFIPTSQQWAAAFAGKLDDLGYQFAEPGTGVTLESDLLQGGWVLEPPSEIATLTIILPPGQYDGQRHIVSTSQTIDAFTAEAAGFQSLRGGGPFVLAENGAVCWIFREANGTWYRWL